MKTGAFEAGIIISSLVCGFLPFLLALCLTSKVPNPTNCTFSSFFKASAITSTNALTVASVAFFVSAVFATIASTNSYLFMFPSYFLHENLN